MDSGRGFMEPINEMFYQKAEDKWPYAQGKKSGVFRIGEEFEIKGAWFRVKKINPFGIMLKSIKSKPTEYRTLYYECPRCGDHYSVDNGGCYLCDHSDS